MASLFLVQNVVIKRHNEREVFSPRGGGGRCTTFIAPVWSTSTPTGPRFNLFELGERPAMKDRMILRYIEHIDKWSCNYKPQNHAKTKQNRVRNNTQEKESVENMKYKHTYAYIHLHTYKNMQKRVWKVPVAKSTTSANNSSPWSVRTFMPSSVLASCIGKERKWISSFFPS